MVNSSISEEFLNPKLHSLFFNKVSFKGETIQRGTFGVIRFAEASDYSFGLDGFETRTCIIKTIYLQRIFEDILKVDELENSQGQLDIHRHDGNFSKNVSPKLFHFYQRLMMEMFVLSRYFTKI